MIEKLTNSLKKYALVILLSVLLVLFKIIFPFNNILSWDVFGYYLYLPAKFIYNDLALQDQNWLNHILETYDSSSTLYQAVKLDNGNWVIKYTLGISILLSPFFFFAHLIAEPLGYPADGFSLPYQYIMVLGGIFYAIIGLVFTQKVLRHFFTKKVSNISLSLLFFGTNYLQLTGFDGTLLSHNFLFTLYAILLYFTIKWHENSTFRNSLFIGLSAGFITLIRPSEAICILLPLLWLDAHTTTIKSKSQLIFQNWPQILFILTLLISVFFLQALYWKSITGNFLYYSYTNAGEGLDFLNPHIGKFLFSFRKGWFIYTPLILFSFVGIHQMIKQKNGMFIAILTFVLFDLYIASSWTTWWYAGGSFSSRSMQPAYAILIIPLAFFIQNWVNYSRLKKYIIGGLLLAFVALNIFQTWQFENGIISRQRMTMAYYFQTFGKTQVGSEDEKLLLVKRSTETIEIFSDSNSYVSHEIYNIDFTSSNYASPILDSGIVLTEENPFSPGIDFKFKDLTQKDHAWIVSEAQVFLPENYDSVYPELVSTFHHKGKAYKYRTHLMLPETVKLGEWNPIKLMYMTPETRSINDNLKVYMWHRGNTDIKIRQLKIRVFEKP